MRIFDSDKYQSLKAATRRACELASPLVEIVKHTRLDAGTISRAGNPNETNYLPLDVAIDLDSMAGEPVILRAMANALGYKIVPTDGFEFAEPLAGAVCALPQESGEAETASIRFEQSPTRANAMRVIEQFAEEDSVQAVIEREALRVLAVK